MVGHHPTGILQVLPQHQLTHQLHLSHQHAVCSECLTFEPRTRPCKSHENTLGH
jgi:hypothetical protein